MCLRTMHLVVWKWSLHRSMANTVHVFSPFCGCMAFCRPIRGWSPRRILRLRTVVSRMPRHSMPFGCFDAMKSAWARCLVASLESGGFTNKLRPGFLLFRVKAFLEPSASFGRSGRRPNLQKTPGFGRSGVFYFPCVALASGKSKLLNMKKALWWLPGRFFFKCARDEHVLTVESLTTVMNSHPCRSV